MLHWMPRILGFAFTIFLGLFALDVYQYGVPLTLLLRHLAPSFLMLAVAGVAWRRPRVGAALYASAGLAYLGWVGFMPGELSAAVRLNRAAVIAGPAFVIAGLLLADASAQVKHGVPAAH